eukprot:3645023-Ditylum_brightwellii.AAC.1
MPPSTTNIVFSTTLPQYNQVLSMDRTRCCPLLSSCIERSGGGAYWSFFPYTGSFLPMPKNVAPTVTSEMVPFKSNFVLRSDTAGDDVSSTYSRKSPPIVKHT